MEHASLTSPPRPGTHQHLPAGHEVGALADPLEDALKLGADEAVVLGDRGQGEAVREEAREGPPWEYLKLVLVGVWGWGRREVKGQELRLTLYPGC